jgi:cell division protein ZapA (FtsZ GTPase activity inhibitor)
MILTMCTKIISDEYNQLSYKYKKICKNFKTKEQKKESLMTKLSKSHALINSLNSEMSMLVKKNIFLENDLKDSKEL